MYCRLIYRSSSGAMEYALAEGTTSIGRNSDNNIQLVSENVSRHHARILNLPSACQIEDLGSTNGTMVNGQKVTSCNLRHEDEIKIAEEAFRFEECERDMVDGLDSSHREYSPRSQVATVRMKFIPSEAPKPAAPPPRKAPHHPIRLKTPALDDIRRHKTMP